MATLEQLGWTKAREEEFAPLAGAGLRPARVALEHNHVYRVLEEGGEALAEAAGRIRHVAQGRHELPAVGDWVGVRVDPTSDRRQIRHVLTRPTAFTRAAVGGRGHASGREARETIQQVVAANIDIVLLVFGLDTPVNPRRFERYLIVARQSGAEPVVVLNKADTIDDTAPARAVTVSVAGEADVVVVSARTGEGLDDLSARLRVGLTMALLGPSGAGKSSIVNRLVGREVLSTGEVREWDARGRHTSVHRQLIVREAGGVLIDTPGMRELQLWEPSGAVLATFPDIAALGGDCRFRDCRHEREPDCAVRRAVDAGEIDSGRYNSFLKLRAEEEAFERRREERAFIDQRRSSRQRKR